MKITSPAWKDNDIIPVWFTGEDRNISPPLEFSEYPEGTKSFALICDDLDAKDPKDQNHPFTHWLIYNIFAGTDTLPEGLPPREKLKGPIYADQGKNSFRKIGYGGPMPPVGSGLHRYVFTLYALDKDLVFQAAAFRHTFLKSIEGHVLATTKITGKYERKS